MGQIGGGKEYLNFWDQNKSLKISARIASKKYPIC